MKRPCWLPTATAALAVLLAACHSDSQPTTAAGAPATPAAAAQTPAAPVAVGGSYRLYRGQLPGTSDSLTLHIVRCTKSVEATSLFAAYASDDGHPHQLLSYFSSNPDSLVLEDVSPEKKRNAQSQGPLWKLLRQGSALVGTYRGQPLRLHEAHPAGALKLVVQAFADSIEAFPGKPKSPWGEVALQGVVPVAGPPALATNIVQQLSGNSLPSSPGLSLAQLWARQRQQFQAEYRQEAQDLLSDAPRDTAAPYGYGLRYQQQSVTYVLWNQAPLLSLGYLTYSFSGGAHGNYATRTISYDTRTGQPLTFATVFRPDARPRLGALLEAAVRRTLRIPAGHPLDEVLLVNKIPVTENFYFTSGGGVFTYVPYEIASYSLGEVSVFIPLADLGPLLLPAAAPLVS